MAEEKTFSVCECSNCGGRIEFESYFAGDSTTCPHCSETTPLEANQYQPNKQIMALTLSSGSELKIISVMLYDQGKIAALNQKKQRIAQLAGGVSTGLMPWGSLEWVAATSIAIGAVESILSIAPQNEAQSLLSESIQDEHDITRSGEFFDVFRITSNKIPTPKAWVAKKQKYLFIHNGDEFLSVKETDGKVSCIRWDSVVRYRID